VSEAIAGVPPLWLVPLTLERPNKPVARLRKVGNHKLAY
jgi:hypothetical protein